MLDSIPEIKAPARFRGMLGFARHLPQILPLASDVIVTTLEQFGHEVLRFEARKAHRLVMVCDTYEVELRQRRVAPADETGALRCRSRLELSLRPIYPAATDPELSELLLAQCLRALLARLEATTVFWGDAPTPLRRAEFLAVFQRQSTPVAKSVLPMVQPKALHATRRKAPRQPQVPPSSARFAPVEDCVAGLSNRCALIIERSETSPSSAGSQATSADQHGVTADALTAMDQLIAPEAAQHTPDGARASSMPTLQATPAARRSLPARCMAFLLNPQGRGGATLLLAILLMVQV